MNPKKNASPHMPTLSARVIKDTTANASCLHTNKRLTLLQGTLQPRPPSLEFQSSSSDVPARQHGPPVHQLPCVG